MLNVALWVVQGLLAGVFLLTGTPKLVLPREVLEKRMDWAAAWPPWRIKLLGLAEVAGAVGLVVPAAMGVAPVLTPIAALCLTVLMVGAVGTHRRLGESAVPAVVIGALCLVVGAARLQLPAPVSPRPEPSQEEGR
jgi:DoxX-like family